MSNLNWALYPNFSVTEFRCKHTGKDGMDATFMAKLQELRVRYGKPMTISSGYRHATHPIEAKKATPGAHATGKAADIAVQGQEAYEILRLALELGFTGIGVQQKGTGRFIHLDTLTSSPRPNVWSY